MEPLVRLLSDLLAIPSMNPMGRNRTGSEYGEAAAADYVARVLGALGADVERQDVAPGRPNVVGSFHTGAPATILLEAHLDTVPADGMHVEPLTPVVRDGRLYGRGACDTKGSLAAFLFAVGEAVRRPATLRYNIVFAAVADEEFGFTGAREAVARGLHADLGIAGEPTRLRIVRAHKGVTRWRIRADGRAAHSAYPERGTNAIYRMAPALVRLEQYGTMLQNGPAHEMLGTGSLSVGVIEGGQAVNIVPDRCHIDVDRRTLPGETTAEVLGAVRSLLGDLPGIRIEEPYLDVPGMDVPETAPVVGLLANAIREVTGDAVVETAPYATDAGIYNRHRIPTVVFGPGDIAQAHTADEYIDVIQLQQASEIVKHLLAS
jgi:acetylornithine deacetylase/succinyl-diaminopimelate desuccinylase family protein